MKPLVVVTCLVIIAAPCLYFYRDHQAQERAALNEKDRTMRSVCPETQPGRKYASQTAVNEFCREKGYFD